MGKSWSHNVASNCLYLFVWTSLCTLFILFFKPSFCNGPEIELEWKTGVENLYNIWILSYTDNWCLVPFSSNISWDRTHSVHSVLTIEGTGSYFSRHISYSLFQSGVHSKQIVIRSMKHALTNRIPVTAMLIRVNEASDWNLLTKHCECSGFAKHFLRTEWNESNA